MTQLLEQAIQKVQALPAPEQDRVAQRLLEELERSGEETEDDPYAFLTVLEEAQLEGRPDESVSYEEALYGLEKDADA